VTLIPFVRPQFTAAWICGIVTGTATAAGVYGRRALNGLMSAVQFVLPALSTGTDALVRQSSMAARLCNENALLEVNKLKRARMRSFDAIILKKRGKGADLLLSGLEEVVKLSKLTVS
jgi:hypothetical protein